MQLRPYQDDAVQRLRASYAASKRAPLFVLPTGGGKTVVFTYVAQNAVARGRSVCILVHRRELLVQASRSLTGMGVRHGVIAPGFNRTLDPVQIASVQTLARRLGTVPQFDLLIVDEGHHASAGTWLKIRDAFPRARLLGVTATPVRSDGQGLDTVFDDIVIGPSMKELVALGYLVPSVVYAPPSVIDLSGVRKRGGDYDQRDVSERIDKPTITGDVIGHYRKLAGGKPAIAFCASVAHAEHVAADFRAAGFKSRSVDGNTAAEERAQAIAALGRGDLHVLTSCDIISEGTDVPAVAAAILLRPTQSLGLYIQQVGRALRTAPGKEKAIILDHVGNVMRHGMPDQDREWTLEGIDRNSNKAANDNVPSVKQCEKCYAAFTPQPICPQCGHFQEVKARKVELADGELIEIDAARVEAMQRERKQEISGARTIDALEDVARKRGYKPGWARYIMKSRAAKYG